MSPHHLSMTKFIGSMPWLDLECRVIFNCGLHGVEKAVSLLLADADVASHYQNDLESEKH